MSGARRYLLIFGLLCGVLAMHGGIGMSGSSMAAMGGTTLSSGVAAVNGSMQGSGPPSVPVESATALHHTPSLPSGPTCSSHSDSCVSPLPPGAGLLAISLVLLGLALLPAVRLRARRRVVRWGCRELPRSRWLDPQTGLGVLRT